MKSKSIQIILRLIIGSLFLFSGISKFFPIEIFELNFVSKGIAGWETAPYLSRILISTEIFLGFALFLDIYLKKFTIPVTIALLVFFTCFLGYSIALDGNVGNCGCFGTVLSLSPLESIIKNILMLGLAIYLFKIVEVKKTSRNWILPLMYVFILVAIFASVPIRKNTDHSMPIKGKTHAIFGTIQGFMGGEKANLNQGKKVVGLFSLGCDHCKEVAMKMSILKKQNNLLPYYFIFVGNEKQVPIFFDDIQDTFPYKVLPMQEFLSIVGHQVPVIYILQDGIVLYKLTYETFTTDRFLKINKNLIR